MLLLCKQLRVSGIIRYTGEGNHSSASDTPEVAQDQKTRTCSTVFGTIAIAKHITLGNASWGDKGTIADRVAAPYHAVSAEY